MNTKFIPNFYFQLEQTKITIFKIFYLVRHSSIIHNFFIYSLGSFLMRGLTIITAPLTMSLLMPNDYGLLALINNFITIMTILAGFGLRQVFSLEYFHADTIMRRQMVNDIIIVYCLVNIPTIILLFMGVNSINIYLFKNSASLFLLLITFVIIIIYFFVEFLYQILQYEGNAKILTLVQTAAATISLGVNIWLLLVMRCGIASIIIGQLISMIVVFAFGIRWYILQNYWLYIDWNRTKKMIKRYLFLGLPFIPSVLCSWLLATGDRWLLAHYLTLHHVGIYSIADTFTQLFQFLFLIPLSNAYLPSLMQQFTQQKRNLAAVEHYNRTIMFWCMIGMAVGLVIGFFLLTPLMRIVLPSSYHEAINYGWLLLIGSLFLMGSYFAAALIQFHKKSYFLAISLLIPALLNIVLNILLIPLFHIYGCVFATIIAYIIYFFILFAYNNYLLKSGKINLCDKYDENPNSG